MENVIQTNWYSCTGCSPDLHNLPVLPIAVTIASNHWNNSRMIRLLFDSYDSTAGDGLMDHVA